MKFFLKASICSLIFGAALAARDSAAPTEITVDAYAPIEAQIEGKPVKLEMITGFADRLTLHTDFVAANGIKPALFVGGGSVNFWGRKEIDGKNRPLDYAIAGRKEKGRAFWFFDVPQPKYDGAIGPWAIPFERVIVRLAPARAAEKQFDFPYLGTLNNGSISGYVEAGVVGTVVSFAIERQLKYPLASAATGAAIAAAYGGTLSGDVWQEPIAFGVTRPVRLLTLERPFVIGPFAFKQIAVRTRSTRDAAGNGAAIAEASDETNVDPAEIVVVGLGKKARKPAFTFAIGRTALNQCASITFDKRVRKIVLSCRPA